MSWLRSTTARAACSASATAPYSASIAATAPGVCPTRDAPTTPTAPAETTNASASVARDGSR